jgi:hypothetical protein
MQSPSRIGDEIVSEVVRQIGGPLPIPPHELAALCGLLLVPHSGEPTAFDASGHAGVVLFDLRLSQREQEHHVALGCARALARAFGHDAQCLELLERVAFLLCGVRYSYPREFSARASSGS